MVSPFNNRNTDGVIMAMAETEHKSSDERKFSKGVIGKTVISKTGKRFGEVGDIVFETKSGELIHLVLKNPTPYVDRLELEKDKEGNALVPFSAVISTGDFVVVAEEDIV